MSVAFPTHVWKMPNICKHIIVWLFAHMCAFSHTYVSKSKHVWKIAPRCKYTNVFGFFQTCWVKVKHLPKCNFTHRFGFFLIYLQKQTCKEKTNMFSLNTTILFFFVGNECDKILLISAQFCLIYFPFLQMHLSMKINIFMYDFNFAKSFPF